jgi:hypothetical protein
MSENHTTTEVRKIRNMLRETVRMAKDASMTGSLEDGRKSSARHYNSAVRHLESLDAIPSGLFPSLAEDASFDEVGVAAAQLGSYLVDDDDTAETPKVTGSHNVFIGWGNLKEMKELKEFGQYIRDHMPDWLKGKAKAKESEGDGGVVITDVESRLTEVDAKVQTVAEQLRRSDLSDEQHADLAEELGQLVQKQARLARERATLRDKQEKEQPPAE